MQLDIQWPIFTKSISQDLVVVFARTKISFFTICSFALLALLALLAFLALLAKLGSCTTHPLATIPLINTFWAAAPIGDEVL